MTIDEIRARKDQVRLRFSEFQEEKTRTQAHLSDVDAELYRLQGENRILDSMEEEIEQAEAAAKSDTGKTSETAGDPAATIDPKAKAKKDQSEPKTMEDFR